MDLTKFQELADNTLGLQPPQYDGRWIQADVWQMYSLGDRPYRNSLPAFKQNQEALFDIIKETNWGNPSSFPLSSKSKPKYCNDTFT